MVTEFLAGGSIDTKLWDKPLDSLSWKEKLVWAHDVALGMRFIHSKGFMHRDLKSPNVLHNATTGRAKVADFGLGRKTQAGNENVVEEVKEEEERDAETVATMMTGGMGSTLWMAPDMMSFGKRIYSSRIDVFSHGVVLWELTPIKPTMKITECRAPVYIGMYVRFRAAPERMLMCVKNYVVMSIQIQRSGKVSGSVNAC